MDAVDSEGLIDFLIEIAGGVEEVDKWDSLASATSFMAAV